MKNMVVIHKLSLGHKNVRRKKELHEIHMINMVVISHYLLSSIVIHMINYLIQLHVKLRKKELAINTKTCISYPNSSKIHFDKTLIFKDKETILRGHKEKQIA